MSHLRTTLAALTCLVAALAAAPASTAAGSSDRSDRAVRADRAGASSKAATVAAKASTKRVITYGRIGKVKARMTASQAVATGEMRANTPGCPGETTRLRPTYPFNNEYIVYVGEDDKIAEMDVFGRHVRTSGGIGIDSTVAAVKKAYGSRLSSTVEVGYGQWGKFVSSGTGANRVWIGFLFGQALVDDGPLVSSDKVTLVGVSRGVRPALMIDGC